MKNKQIIFSIVIIFIIIISVFIYNNKRIIDNDWRYPEEVQQIINSQLTNWPNDIENTDCSKLEDEESILWCNDERNKIEERKKEITWEQVWKKWPEYILKFDCFEIINEYWNKYCIEEQEKLNNK